MNNFILILCAGSLAACCGCVTAPPADTTVSATYVGDRARVAFDEIVVSLPFRGASGPYQNLHVALAALVNPRKASFSNPYQAQDILRRIEARASAKVSESLSTAGGQSLEDTERLRQKVRTEAQEVVNEALRQWEHGADYRVEIAVVTLYWTDASVGRAQPQTRGWW